MQFALFMSVIAVALGFFVFGLWVFWLTCREHGAGCVGARTSTALSTGGRVLMRAVGDRNRWNQAESDAIHAGDGTAPDAKARIMRAFSWAMLGKGCIRMRQDRTERDVVQDTLF